MESFRARHLEASRESKGNCWPNRADKSWWWCHWYVYSCVFVFETKIIFALAHSEESTVLAKQTYSVIDLNVGHVDDPTRLLKTKGQV